MSCFVFFFPLAKPSFIIQPQDTEVLIGTNTTLECMATGHPHPHVTWTRGSGEALDESRHLATSGGLYLQNVTLQDHGQFTCHANNNQGSVQATANIIVQGMGAGGHDWNVHAAILRKLFFNLKKIMSWISEEIFVFAIYFWHNRIFKMNLLHVKTWIFFHFSLFPNANHH